MNSAASSSGTGGWCPALQTPDSYKCQPAHRAAAHCTALRCAALHCTDVYAASTKDQQAVDLSPRGGIGKGAGETG